MKELSAVDPKSREGALNFLMAKKTRWMNLPNHVSMELTPLCPLSCKMCYIKAEGLKPGAHDLILSVDQWRAILDQVVDQGVESITLTGGEALFYPGFFDVYNYAYDKGMQITLMTNGVLIDQAAVRAFLERPPKLICMTLYGASGETYESLCGAASAYDQALRGIDLLLAAKLPLALQGTITQENQADLEKMIAFVEEKSIPYRYSGNLFSARECSTELVEAEYVRPLNWQDRKKAIEEKLRSGKRPDLQVVTHGSLCGAGRNSYHINWRGSMQPCVLLDAFQVSLLSSSVAQAWEQVRDWVKGVPQLVECQMCPAYLECGQHCLAAHYNETHEFGVPAPRLCWKKQLRGEQAPENAHGRNL